MYSAEINDLLHDDGPVFPGFNRYIAPVILEHKLLFIDKLEEEEATYKWEQL